MEQVEVAVVLSDREAAESVAAAAKADDPGTDVQVGEQRGLAGGAAEWVVFTSIARALPALLQAVGRLAGRGQVTVFRIGDVEITNPSREDVERGWELAFAREERLARE